MAVILVTYDLKQPGRNYQPVYDYLKTHTWCKGIESVWLLDTTKSVSTIRDEIGRIVDSNDIIFVVRLMREWASRHYYCGDWLNSQDRNW